MKVQSNEHSLAQAELASLRKDLCESERQVGQLKTSLARADEDKNQAITKASNELYSSIQNSFKADLASKQASPLSDLLGKGTDARVAERAEASQQQSCRDPKAPRSRPLGACQSQVRVTS